MTFRGSAPCYIRHEPWEPIWDRFGILLKDSMQKKKPTWPTPEVFNHVGLLVNEPPGTAGLPFI